MASATVAAHPWWTCRWRTGSSADGDVRSEVAEEHADGKGRPNVEAGPREKGEEAVPASLQRRSHSTQVVKHGDSVAQARRALG